MLSAWQCWTGCLGVEGVVGEGVGPLDPWGALQKAQRLEQVQREQLETALLKLKTALLLSAVRTGPRFDLVYNTPSFSTSHLFMCGWVAAAADSTYCNFRG